MKHRAVLAVSACRELEASDPGKPDTALAHYKELVESVIILGKHALHVHDLTPHVLRMEAEEDHAGRWQALLHNQLTEVAAVGHQDAALSMGKRNYRSIRERVRIVMGDGSDVMPVLALEDAKAELRALI